MTSAKNTFFVQWRIVLVNSIINLSNSFIAEICRRRFFAELFIQGTVPDLIH